MQSTARCVSFSFLVACGGGSVPAPTHAEATPQPSATTAASPTTTDARDPKLVEMAKAARACAKGEKVYDFDSDCAGYKAWRENEDAFADGKADDTIFALLGDRDPRFHYLAFTKAIQPAYWKDKTHAKALFALARAETNDDVLRKLADYVALVDADAAGLGVELKDFAKHPSAAFRKELAFQLVRHTQTPVALEVEQLFLADADKDVKESAVIALSADGTPATEPVCALLRKQMTRADDDLYAVGIAASLSSTCPRLRDEAIAELERRVSDPAKVGLHAGAVFTSALSGQCLHADLPESDKKKAFALAAKLTDPKVPDSMVRERAVDALFVCDWSALEKMLPKLHKDAQIGDHLKTVEEGIKSRKARRQVR